MRLLIGELGAGRERFPCFRNPAQGSVRHPTCLANAGPKSRKRKYATARRDSMAFCHAPRDPARKCGKLHRSAVTHVLLAKSRQVLLLASFAGAKCHHERGLLTLR
jgi:hypothetical protein